MTGASAAAPLLSVVMPFRDPGDLLEPALGQLDALRHGPGRSPGSGEVEIVVVDDGSTDGSPETVADWVARRDDAVLVTVASSPATPAGSTAADSCHGGVARARDAGVRAARGTYIWMVDCDDRIPPETVDLVLPLLSVQPGRSAQSAPVAGGDTADTPDMVCFRAQVTEPSGRVRTVDGAPRRPRRSPRLLDRDGLAAALLDGTVRGYLWTKVIRRSVLAGVLDRYPHTSSQSDFMTVLACVPDLHRTLLLPDTGYGYVQRQGSVSTTDTRQLDNTARCADLALSVLPPMVGGRLRPRILAASFRVWFHLVPCCATPVHQAWPPGRVRDVHRGLLPGIGVRGIVCTALTGHPGVAAHAVVLRCLGPAGLYPPVYRTGRALLDAVSGRVARHSPQLRNSKTDSRTARRRHSSDR